MSKKQLTIYISRTSVHIAEVLRSNQEVITEHSFELLENNEEGYKNKLNEIFNELSLQEEYQEYSLAWGTPHATLVPLGVFNESSAKQVHQFMFGDAFDDNTIDFNRLMELSMVNVFEIPNWIKYFFIMKFPRILIQHEHTMFLRAIFQKSTFERKAFVSFYNQYINIDIVYHNELTFSNSFEIQTVDDVMYYLAFVLEKENLQNEKGEINLLYSDTNSKELAIQTKDKLQAVKLLQNYSISEVDSVLKLQVLCV